MMIKQLEWFFGRKAPEQPAEDWLIAGARRVRVCFVKNRRARRYILRLKADAVARVTVPRGGSLTEARRFAERHTQWLEKQLSRQASTPPGSAEWRIGSQIWFRGELVRLETAGQGTLGFGTEQLSVPDVAGNLRPAIERHLRQIAAREFPPLVLEFAARHALRVNRVTVRNQRSRWGSCSRRGQISLNWRLVQTPASVRDYIILHELAHLRQMNHSSRFWAEVARLCPDFEAAERWLKTHSSLLS